MSEWEWKDGSRGHDGGGRVFSGNSARFKRGPSFYSRPVGLLRPELQLQRDADVERQIRHRVWGWRVKVRIRAVPWGLIEGALLMLCSAALMTWLALSFAEWALR